MSIEIQVPVLGESVSEATIAKIYKNVGEAIAADEILVELETDKVTLEVNAPSAGAIAKINFAEGDNVTVGQVLAIMNEGEAGSAKATEATNISNQNSNIAQNATISNKESDHLSPAPNRIINENNLDQNSIKGTGKDGRITKEDAQNALNNKGNVANSTPAIADAKPVERVRMSKLRQIVASRLKESQNTAAILTTFNEVDMTNVMALRNEYKDQFLKKHDVKLGFMSFFVKAAIAALKDIPAVNAEIDGTDIIYKNYYDIGVAVGSPQGLVVPVLRNADKLSISGTESGILDLALKARDGKLAVPDLTGATFTISNGGVYGSLMSTPIINPPQSGILGMHKIQERPMVVNGEIKIRPMMYLALSYDHRIIDGKEAVTFLVKIKELIEDPRRLLLDI
ncbi:2-oxoglutarate dehydrogenase complex dihydrolipoyllysine-residue succinyltransferase [Rickettsiales bacterium]|nr:2-oxoglutarate dehydrogenase complex dihydrolipoyllysine-residue succinyltransferase [Rickettsiales bacterium]